MITIQIGDEQRAALDATESWINDQLRRRHRDEATPCVIVTVETSGVNVRLATVGCAGGAGGRTPNPRESEILELWKRRRLNMADFTSGNLIAFLAQLKKLT